MAALTCPHSGRKEARTVQGGGTQDVGTPRGSLPPRTHRDPGRRVRAQELRSEPDPQGTLTAPSATQPLREGQVVHAREQCSR